MDQWISEVLANPVTKLPQAAEDFAHIDGVIDARVYLPHTPGFRGWSDGQSAYEMWSDKQTDEKQLRAELNGVADVYSHIKMGGTVLDVGGHIGLVREFLPADTRFISVDPFISIQERIPVQYRNVYSCLSSPLNFIASCAEFLPFTAGTFDWVHMRSMLDHVQSPDLALLEAGRVLKQDGRLVIGLWIHGGRTGRSHLRPRAIAKEAARTVLGAIGIRRYRDHHTFHPTLSNLLSMLGASGFKPIDLYWQPAWEDQVCYITAIKV
jgi:SAM-dependent methyltransferase